MRYSLDELMLQLYGPSLSLEQWLRRDEQILAAITPQVRYLLSIDQGVIFDWSCETVALRERFIRLAQDAGHDLTIDAFNICPELAWQRIKKRNYETNAYPVDETVFQTSLGQWQPPQASENAHINWWT